MYLIFGVLTTVVSFSVYFTILWGGRALFDIPASDTTGGAYLAVYTAAQIISWICAVLFAFATNRAWVFTDADRSSGIFSQLAAFSCGRLITLGLDYLITYAGGLLLAYAAPSLSLVYIGLLDKSININEVLAKAAAAVAVIIGNYIFSKLFVFRKPKGGKTA